MNKICTSVEQSKKLIELGIDVKTADMCWQAIYDEDHLMSDYRIDLIPFRLYSGLGVPAWSLAALLEYINRNFYKISLNYCGGEYTITFDDGDNYKSITKDYSIDAAYELVCWLSEHKKI